MKNPWWRRQVRSTSSLSGRGLSCGLVTGTGVVQEPGSAPDAFVQPGLVVKPKVGKTAVFTDISDQDVDVRSRSHWLTAEEIARNFQHISQRLIRVAWTRAVSPSCAGSPR